MFYSWEIENVPAGVDQFSLKSVRVFVTNGLGRCGLKNQISDSLRMAKCFRSSTGIEDHKFRVPPMSPFELKNMEFRKLSKDCLIVKQTLEPVSKFKCSFAS